MNYRTIEDLNKDVRALVPKLPLDLDLIVGVPRSGLLAANLLALYLNLPFTDVEGLCEGRIIESGMRLTINANSSQLRSILIIDDSINSGTQMQQVKNRVEKACLKCKIYFGVIYATQANREFVDYYSQIVEYPRIFEWNIKHHPFLSNSCMDLDGVLCRDPTDQENDDDQCYKDFITNVEPMYVPSVEIGWIVTCRLEKYRNLTEEWLKRHSIKYNHLVMMDLPDQKTRIALGNYASYKANVYKSTGAMLFIESSLKQANEIYAITGKDVFCVENNQLVQGNVSNFENTTTISNDFQKTIDVISKQRKTNPKSTHVLFFSHSSELQGAERSLLELTRQLIHNHRSICTVILPYKGPLKRKLEEIGASTYIINYQWWCDSNVLSSDDITFKLGLSFQNILNELWNLNKIDPDVVITNSIVIPWGAIFANFLDKPHAWFIREFGELDHKLKFFFPFQEVLKIVKDFSNVVLVNSNAVGKKLFESVDTKIIYPPVSIPIHTSSAVDESYFTKPDKLKLIILGTISEGKGQKDAILAVRELISRGRSIELLIMGSGRFEYLEHLHEIVTKSSLERFIHFSIFKENPYPAIEQADIVLVCSQNEAFGRTVLEGMLLKKPVIGTNSGGIPESIRDGYSGLLYEPGNSTQLADKIEYFIHNKEKIRDFGENGYKFVKENFPEEKSGDELAKLITGLKGSTNRCSSIISHFTIKNRLTQVPDFSEILQVKRDHVIKLEAKLEEKNEEISKLKRALQIKDEQLQQVQSGISMRLLRKYRRTIDKILRSGTRRRYYYELTLKGIGVILNQGWRSFFKKAITKLKF
jgi:orotate phosphoribosyltransferase